MRTRSVVYWWSAVGIVKWSSQARGIADARNYMHTVPQLGQHYIDRVSLRLLVRSGSMSYLSSNDPLLSPFLQAFGASDARNLIPKLAELPTMWVEG